MRFIVLGLAATAALAVSANSASAQWATGHGYSPYGYTVLSPGAHLDYHNGHYHYHDGFYRSGPLYPNYGIGFQLSGAPGLRVNSGTGYSPLWYGGYSNYYGLPNYRSNMYGNYRWRW